MGGLLSGKILVLLAVGLIVLGPEKLPEMARTLGRIISEVRRVSTDLRQEVTSAFGEDITGSVTEFRAAADSWRATATSWVAGPGGAPAGSVALSSRVLVPDDELAFPPGDPSLN